MKNLSLYLDLQDDGGPLMALFLDYYEVRKPIIGSWWS